MSERRRVVGRRPSPNATEKTLQLSLEGLLASGGGGFPCRGVRGDSGRRRARLRLPFALSLVLPLVGSAGSSRSWVHSACVAAQPASSHSFRVAGRWSFQPSSLTLQGFMLRVYEVPPFSSTRGVGSSFRSTFLAFAPPSETSVHSAHPSRSSSKNHSRILRSVPASRIRLPPRKGK